MIDYLAIATMAQSALYRTHASATVRDCAKTVHDQSAQEPKLLAQSGTAARAQSALPSTPLCSRYAANWAKRTYEYELGQVPPRPGESSVFY